MVKKIQKSKKSPAKIETGKTKSTAKKSFSTKDPQTMDELLASIGGLSIGLKKGDTIKGTVSSTSSREILVDIGRKSYGIVAEWELEQVKDYSKTLSVGDKITAQVMNPENDMGYVVLSLRKSNTEKRWVSLEKLVESGEDIEVNGLETAKGGLLVDWRGLRGFIPSSQLEASVSSNPASLINQRVKVKVLEVDKAMNRLVVSQKASVLGVTPTIQKEKLKKVKKGDTLKGIVSGVAPFGLFIDVEGLEGLVHISEIAWEKVDNPGRMHKVSDKVEVMVLDVNKDEGKLNLSIKRLMPDPWKNILDRYPHDTAVKGKVVRVMPYGVFVQLEPGVEGLIHISKITVGSEPQLSEDVECLIENIDTVKRKISLTVVPKEKPVGYR